MIVRVEQENVVPKTQSSSTSNLCMVLRGGTIPASLQTFPGMEHDRGLFNGLSQDTTSNGISQIIESSNVFDDEREIEAAAAASEAQMKSSFLASTAMATVPPVTSVPPVVIPTATPLMVPNQTLSPLHISIGESPKSGDTTTTLSNGSKDNESSNNGFQGQRKTFQLPVFRTLKDCPPRPNTSVAPPPSTPIIMGPPTNSNVPVLLSPAGNLHNGYHRMSSGDSAPSSPSITGRSLPKGQMMHPLSSQKCLPPPSRLLNNSLPPSGHPTNRSSCSTASPQNGRKDHEMTRRRALVDRIAKSRGPEYVHLLPQVEGLTTTQTSILLRKHRGSLQANGMPYSLQQLIDCGAEPDKTTEEFVKKIKDANHKRVRYNDFDDLTDMSDLEEDFECYKNAPEPKKEKDAPRWAPKRMRYSGMLSRAEVLLAEKIALMGMLKNQITVMDASCGVRYRGEGNTRRRRKLNGMYYLYDKSPFHRISSIQFGCARAMPLYSWTKRKPHKDIFEDGKDDRSSGTSGTALKPTANPNEKWVATAQYNVVSYLSTENRNKEKETREIFEYDYEEYKSGEGLQQVNELSSFDPLDFIATPDFTPFEERQMAYMYRLSTAPSCTIRKKHGRAIYFETDDRKNVSERSSDLKKKGDKKKERKRVDDASSDEEETWTASKTPAKKRARGRPAAVGTGRKKTSRASVTAKPEHGIYMDYLFDDQIHDDFNAANLPPLAVYAHIHVPEWDPKAIPDFWEDIEEPLAEDSLLHTVAEQHHTLVHEERNRIKKDNEKRNRNRPSALKFGAATPQNQNSEKKEIPPFDMSMFDSHFDPSRRRFTSVVKSFVQREFSADDPFS